MSVFTSNRPENSDEALEKIIKLKSDRRSNINSITEEFHQEAESKLRKKELDEQDKEVEDKKVLEANLYLSRSRRSDNIKKQKVSLLEKTLIDNNEKELFNQVIFEMVYNAYWLDDTVKENADITALYNTYNAVKESVAKILPESSSIFIDEVKNVVHSICEKSAARITSEVKDEIELKDIEDIDEVNFNLSEVEEIELSDNLSELGKEDIEQLVKDKVLSVVQDEKQAGEEKQKLFKEIDDSVNALNGNEVSDDSESSDETGTNESVSIATRNFRNRFKRGNNSTVFETLMVQSNKQISENIVTEGLSVTNEAKASAVFADTIFKYTVLETLHTIGLYKFDRTVMESVINSLKDM